MAFWSAGAAAPSRTDPARAHLDRAVELEQKSDLAGALAELELALAVREKTGKDSLGAAAVHGLIAGNRLRAGKLDEALEAGKRQLALREKLLGEHLDTAEAHARLFQIYKFRGDALNALKHGEAAFAIRDAKLPPGDPLVGEAARSLGEVYIALKRTAEADKAYRRMREIFTNKPGREYDLVAALEGTAQVYRLQERHVEAEAEFRRALALLEKIAPDDLGRAELLSSIGDTLISQSEYEKAIVEMQRGLAIASAGGAESRVAMLLGNLATAYGYIGDYDRAIPLQERALAIYQKVSASPLEALVTENNLAQVLSEHGEYAKALAHFEAVLPKFKQLVGDNHPNVGTVLLNTAVVRNRLGNRVDALALARQALAIFDANNPEGATAANAANILGDFEDDAGNTTVAEALFRRAIAINTKLRGVNNRITGESMRQLGLFLLLHGRAAEGERQLAAALDAIVHSESPDHPSAFETRSLLGLARWQLGKMREAEAVLREALAAGERRMGPKNPRIVETLNRLSNLLAVTGREPEALALRARSIAIRDRELALRLSIGSEREKLEAFELVAAELDTVLTHQLHDFKTPAATAMALDLVLRRKGRVLESMSRQLQAVRARLAEGDRELLDELDSTRKYLATLTIKGPPAKDRGAYDAKVDQLARRLDNLETKLGAIGAALVRDRDVGLDVRALLPSGSALVEIVRYRVTDPKVPALASSAATARFMAFVAVGDAAPTSVDLGEASVIETAVTALRHALGDPHSADLEARARALDELVMRPLRPLLHDAHSILLAPDGSLNLVPFAALRDEDGRYLISRYQFTYLDTGRDLARLANREPPRQSAILVGAPRYGSPAAGARAADRSDDLAMQFSPLPGTATELADLAKIVPGARVYRGDEATEGTLKTLHGPAILHVATHGFFLQDEDVPPGSRGLIKVARTKTTRVVENPLLRSGIALAGANQLASGDDDGILTALEVSGLDLRGTRLVVLSACDTGVGDVKNGNGVFGLRRALVAAGSETQVMSLWKVDDQATHELMTSYYRSIIAGRGRSEAMRIAQLEIGRARPHPYFWASFIVSGDFRTLEGGAGVAPRPATRARGCGACHAGGEPSVLLVVACVILRRRRRASRRMS